MDYAALFEANLATIDGVIARVCRRARLFGADAEDFASTAKLALMENDYAALRRFEGRCALATFLTIVIQRLLFDDVTRRAGRWHPSREAESLGEAAIELEKIVRREGRTLDEALPIVRAIDPTLTRERLEEMEARLPVRAPRARMVGMPEGEPVFAAPERADDRVVAAEATRLSDRTGEVIRQALETLELEDRMIIRFHFGSALTLKQISEALRLPQRPLYRRVEGLMSRFRKALAAAGIQARDVADLIGSTARELNFGLGNPEMGFARRTDPSEASGAEEAR